MVTSTIEIDGAENIVESGIVHELRYRTLFLKRSSLGLVVYHYLTNFSKDQIQRPYDLNPLPSDLSATTALDPVTVLTSDSLFRSLRETDSDLSQPIFAPPTQAALQTHIVHLSQVLNTDRYSTKSTLFLSRVAHLLDDTFRRERILTKAFSLYRTSDETGQANRFGVFAAFFPEFDSKILKFQILPAQVGKVLRLANHQQSWATDYMREAIANLRRQLAPITVEQLIQQALVIRERLVTAENGQPISLKDLVQWARDIVNESDPSMFSVYTNPKEQIKKLPLAVELDILQGTVPEHIAQMIVLLQKRTEELRFEEGITIDQERVNLLLRQPEMLVNPRDFGLEPDQAVSALIRRHIEDSQLDSEQTLTETEREQLWGRIVYIPIEELRKNPEGFFAYQQALILRIAELIDPQLLDKRFLVPLPAYVKDGLTRNSFRAQERFLKQLDDWHYLLLYKPIQDIFLAHLPFCGAPPMGEYQLADNQEQKQLFFPWKVPNGIKDKWQPVGRVRSDVPFLNHLAEERGKVKQILTIPALLAKRVQDLGGFLVTLSGTARAYFTGVNWEKVNSADYVMLGPASRNRQPFFDVDFHGFSEGDIASLAVDTVRSIHPRYGLFAGVDLGRAMKGTTWAYISRQQRDRTHRTSRADAPETFVTVAYAWPGRAVKAKTDLLALGALSTIRMRTPGLIPVIRRVAGRWVAFVKPVDLYNGLSQLETRVNGRMPMDVVSKTDVLPQNQVMSYWMLVRMMSDTIWLKGTWDWEWLRQVVGRLVHDLSYLKDKEQEFRFEDLSRDARKALDKALADDVSATLALLGYREIEYKYTDGIEGVGFSKLYPNLDRLRKATYTARGKSFEAGLIWRALWYEAKYFKNRRMYQGYKGLALLARIVFYISELRLGVARDLNIPILELSESHVVDWLSKTIFDQTGSAK